TGLQGMMARWIRHPFAVTRALEIEWRAQLERLRDAGLTLSHADSHQHLHAFPPAWKCAVKLCAEFGIPSLRLPREKNHLPFRRAGALALSASLTVATLMPSSLCHNDHFLGFKRAGRYGPDALHADLRTVQPGLTEIALHPSTEDGAPYPGLLGDGERRALLAQSLPKQCADLGIELTTWRDIAPS
ncbi:MAG: ChbG/HpnK family deacetylase, partial [Blastocatellia bacterium]